MHFLALFNGAGCFMGAFFVQTAHAGTQGKSVLMTGVPEQFSNIIDLENQAAELKGMPKFYWFALTIKMELR